MNKYRLAAILMSLAAVLFLLFALTNPQASFPWSNTVTYILYAVYLIVMAVLFGLSFQKK